MIATSLVLIVVFLPVLVMPGSLGRLYQPLAVVISSTILFSTINALSFTPVASRCCSAARLALRPGKPNVSSAGYQEARNGSMPCSSPTNACWSER